MLLGYIASAGALVMVWWGPWVQVTGRDIRREPLVIVPVVLGCVVLGVWVGALGADVRWQREQVMGLVGGVCGTLAVVFGLVCGFDLLVEAWAKARLEVEDEEIDH